MKRRIVFAVALAVVLAGGAGFTQGSDRVLQNRYVLGPITGQLIGNCADVGVGDFFIFNDFTASIHDMMLLDEDGQPKQLIENIKVTWDIYYNSETGRSVEGAHGENSEQRYLFENGQTTWGQSAGPSYRVSVPGLGTIYSETGRVTFHWDPLTGAYLALSNSGHNDYLDQDITALCEYLK